MKSSKCQTTGGEASGIQAPPTHTGQAIVAFGVSRIQSSTTIVTVSATTTLQKRTPPTPFTPESTNPPDSSQVPAITSLGNMNGHLPNWSPHESLSPWSSRAVPTYSACRSWSYSPSATENPAINPEVARTIVQITTCFVVCTVRPRSDGTGLFYFIFPSRARGSKCAYVPPRGRPRSGQSPPALVSSAGTNTKPTSTVVRSPPRWVPLSLW